MSAPAKQKKRRTFAQLSLAEQEVEIAKEERALAEKRQKHAVAKSKEVIEKNKSLPLFDSLKAIQEETQLSDEAVLQAIAEGAGFKVSVSAKPKARRAVARKSAKKKPVVKKADAKSPK